MGLNTMVGERSRRNFLKAVGAGGTVALSGVAGCLGGSDDESIQVGIVDPISEPISALDIPELQEKAGNNVGDVYELDVTIVGDTPTILNQLASDEIQLGNSAYVSFPRAIQQEAVPGGATAVAAEIVDAEPGYRGFPVHSLEGSGIDDVEDLEGATIGVNALGTGVHGIVVLGLLQNGIDPNEDVEWVEFGFPEMGSALREERMDAGIFVPVFSTAEQAEGGIQTVFTSKDVWDVGYDFAFQITRTEFAEENSAVLEAYLEDYVSLLEYIHASENREEVIQLMSEHYDLPAELLDAFWLTDNDFFHPLDAQLDISRFQEVLDRLTETDFLDSSITAADHMTNEYLPDG